MRVERRPRPLRIAILGLTITSSWGNGHATTFRGLVRALAARGHRVLFLERDAPWYAENRDLPRPPYGRTVLYRSIDELVERHAAAVRAADLVVVGSYVPDGIEVGEWVTRTAGGTTAFYDIDTPRTLACLESGDAGYVSRDLIRRYDVYFSFTGGPTLRRLELEFGARRAEALHCAVDPRQYHPVGGRKRWELGYMGTYSADRQPSLERLLLEPARRRPSRSYVVAGPQYPPEIEWPENVERLEHLSPSSHPGFYSRQRFTLNVTRADMVQAGWSPSVRLFEAAACGTPVVTDVWPGLEEFFEPGGEILVAESADDCERILRDTSPSAARAIGRRARRRVLAEHTPVRRAAALEACARALARA